MTVNSLYIRAGYFLVEVSILKFDGVSHSSEQGTKRYAFLMYRLGFRGNIQRIQSAESHDLILDYRVSDVFLD